MQGRRSAQQHCQNRLAAARREPPRTRFLLAVTFHGPCAGHWHPRNDGKKLNDLLAEALNDLFAKYDVPQTAMTGRQPTAD